jgi:undecaprenyl-diphosphatase
MGLFQGLAILPGISRSGATISSAIVQGINKKDAAEFSFLMSIPIILASLVWELLKFDPTVTTIKLLPTAFGFVFALLFGIIAIKIMLKIIEKAKYYYFSTYLIALSIFLMLNSLVFNWF